MNEQELTGLGYEWRDEEHDRDSRKRGQELTTQSGKVAGKLTARRKESSS